METQKSVIDIRRIEDMYEEVKVRFGELSEKIDKQVDRIERTTKERPRTSLAVSFVSGVVLAGLLAMIVPRRRNLT